MTQTRCEHINKLKAISGQLENNSTAYGAGSSGSDVAHTVADAISEMVAAESKQLIAANRMTETR